MSTRCNIAVQTGDAIQIVYSHWDGYPSGMGLVLQQFFPTKENAKELVSGGDISAIDWKSGEVNYYAQRGKWDKHKEVDEVWDNVKPRWFNNYKNFIKYCNESATMIAFFYLFKDGAWHGYRYDDVLNEIKMDKGFLTKAREDNKGDDVEVIRKVA